MINLNSKVLSSIVVTSLMLVVPSMTFAKGDSGKSGKSGKSGNGDPLTESCTPCKGGLSSMTLINDGASGTADVTGKKGRNLFSEYVEAGATFTYDSNGKMENSIFINGSDIHTSCSKPINAGMKIGDFTLVSATSAKTGSVLCTLPIAPPPNETGSVCGVVYNDINNNGIRDNGEEGTRGIIVSVLDANGNTTTARTRITGSYCIKNVAVGNATVTIKESTLPPTANLTVGDNPSDVLVEANTRNNAGKDGYTFPADPIDKTGKVCGVIFLDTNANDRFDRSDELLDNVTINVKDSNGNNIASETTNSTGRYCMSDIPVGRVSVEIDEDTLPENNGQVVGENPSSLMVKVDEINWAGSDGFALPNVTPQTGKVCGSVFHDVNHNGQKDANEEGSAGILIKVLTESGNEVNGHTVTGGNYCISNLPKGSVEVTVVESTLPSGLNLTVGTNPTHVAVIANEQNNAGIDGYTGTSTCDCSLCQGT